MRMTSLFLVLASVVLPAHGASTLGQLLGGEKTRAIIREVLEKKIGQYNQGAAYFENRRSSYRQTGADDRKFVYGIDFIDTVSERVLVTQITSEMTAHNAEEFLRNGFGIFVDHLKQFARTTVQDRTIRLDKELFDAYMKKALAANLCGEVPCNQPPCCRNCAPPPCNSEIKNYPGLPSMLAASIRDSESSGSAPDLS